MSPLYPSVEVYRVILSLFKYLFKEYRKKNFVNAYKYRSCEIIKHTQQFGVKLTLLRNEPRICTSLFIQMSALSLFRTRLADSFYRFLHTLQLIPT